ncbi:YidC/Oxa1 family membrane protein insertase [Candidatus Roizmanbacteria bacterium]|nr:YidC/Oxa1 family membrane protein insertase [Candidatus Roizmanbacteria bacterium]
MLGSLFHTIFFQPLLNLLVVFYNLFLFIHLPGAFGFAIIALTLFIRLVLNPFFKQNMEMTKKMQDLKPHLDGLSKKHKGDPKKLQAEQMRLYKEAGVNPASGCLFMFIQIPVFLALYQTLQRFLINGYGAKVVAEINKLLYSPNLHIKNIDPMFFGINLALSPSKVHVWYYYLIPLVTGVLQYLQIAATAPSSGSTMVKKEAAKDDKKEDSQDFQKAMNTQMKIMFPLMIGYFAYILPVGLSLYWNIISLFSIMQYRKK